MARTTHGAGAPMHETGVTPGRFLEDDGDTDPHPSGTAMDGDDHQLLENYPHPVTGGERRAVSELLDRFYLATADGNAATACSLLDLSLATGLAQAAGTRPGGCAASLARLLRVRRRELRQEEVSKLTVWSVRTRGSLGVALVGFPDAPERSVSIVREGRQWRVASIADSEIP